MYVVPSADFGTVRHSIVSLCGSVCCLACQVRVIGRDSRFAGRFSFLLTMAWPLALFSPVNSWAKLCILDDTRIEPLIRVDKVLSTRIMPEDPHNIALEAGLKEAIPLVDKISFQGDLIVLENDNGRVCLALEKIKKEGDTQDNN